MTELIGTSPAMREVKALIERIARTQVSVLLTGDTGTGKEEVARLLHQRSARRGAFTSVNCAALPEGLAEAELFGVAPRAHTNVDGRPGYFERASGGTLLLDEVGELPPAQQTKLLRVLQERAVIPVGGQRSVAVDVRLVSATNRDLEKDVATGRFRSDLFFRLRVIHLHLPPLVERVQDIPELAAHLIRKASVRHQVPALPVSAAALERLRRHRWPGNVRELEHVLERALVLCDGDQIGADDLVGLERPAAEPPERLATGPQAAERLLHLLREHEGNIRAVARELRCAEDTVYRRLKRFGIDPARFRPKAQALETRRLLHALDTPALLLGRCRSHAPRARSHAPRARGPSA